MVDSTETATKLTLAQEADMNRRLYLYEMLETARRRICTYSGDPCDCKYGITRPSRPASEATGCCELRDLIREWTGFTPYNRGQSVDDDVREWEEAFRANPSRFDNRSGINEP